MQLDRKHPGLLASPLRTKGDSCACVLQPGLQCTEVSTPVLGPHQWVQKEGVGCLSALNVFSCVLGGRGCPLGMEQNTKFISCHPTLSLQDFHSLATYLSQNTSSVFLDTISDFHLLLFLVTNEVMPLQVRTEQACPLSTWRWSSPDGAGFPRNQRGGRSPLASCGQRLCTRGLLIESGIFHIKCRPSVMGLVSLEGSHHKGRSGGSSMSPIVGQQRPRESPVLIVSEPQPCFPMSPSSQTSCYRLGQTAGGSQARVHSCTGGFCETRGGEEGKCTGGSCCWAVGSRAASSQEAEACAMAWVAFLSASDPRTHQREKNNFFLSH